MTTQHWTVGDSRITRVVEDEILHLPPDLFFPDATVDDVLRHPWLRPDFADEDGNLAFAVQAFVLEHAGRTLLIDPCVGNGKTLAFFAWNEQSYPFLERFEAAGFAPDAIETVVHTHLHADHIGWDTVHRDGVWVPTFPNARHLYNEAELEHRHRSDAESGDKAYEQSIAPIFAAGLADLVADDADLGDGLRLEATPGHTPGHVSLWVESAGETALITGDFLHHQLQCVRPDLRELADVDVEQARETRDRMLAVAAEREVLFVGTHFPTFPAGRVRPDGGVYRFEPARS